MPASVAMPAVRQNRSKLAPTSCQASSTIATGSTPSLLAQGGQRLPHIFNIGRDIPVPVALAAALFLPTVGQIAERHPGLKLIVDHMGVPPGSRGEAAYRFQPELLALAKYPNVAVKATGQAGYAEDGYPFRSLHPHLHRCFAAFGPERMFWGTDITRMPCSWRQCVTLFTKELPWLKGRDLDLVMGEALCNWIGWPLPANGER